MKKIFLLLFLFPIVLPAQNMLEGKWMAYCSWNNKSGGISCHCSLCETRKINLSTVALDSFNMIFSKDSLTIMQSKNGVRRCPYKLENDGGLLHFNLDGDIYEYYLHVIARERPKRMSALVDAETGCVILLESE